MPAACPAHGRHHWQFERLLAAALVPLALAPFAAGSLHPAADAALGAVLVLHSHTGFQWAPRPPPPRARADAGRACVADYIPRRRYPRARRAARAALNAATLLVLYGVYEFETSDVGIVEGVKRVWTARAQA